MMAPDVATKPAEPRVFHLPLGVATVGDLGRMIEEIESLDDFLAQAAIRTAGTPVTLPKISKLCEEMVEENGLNMLQAGDRTYIRTFLHKIKDQAPVIHMSFSSEASARFTQKIVEYLRKDIHPVALLSLGLQPNIGAGCVLRTRNKYFDLTLRKNLEAKRADLIEYLGKAAKA